MADPKDSQKSNELDRHEHISKGELSAKQVAINLYDAGSDTLIPPSTANPLPTTSQLTVVQSIDVTAYDLAAAPYSQVVTPVTGDYIIDNFQLEFSTTESRTITLTSDNGTKIYEATNTSASVAVGSINFGQESGDSFTLAITQTSGACTVDVALYIKNSPVALTADPVIAPGTNIIGTVRSIPMEISKGNLADHSTVHKFGTAPDFDTGDGTVSIWDAADDGVAWQQMKATYSTTADIDRVSSTSGSDTFDVEIQGLDTNYDLVTQTITLTGQTPANLTTSLIRVFRMKNVGSADNVGSIFCFVNVATTAGVPDTPANIRAVIRPLNNQTLMAIYTVPNGKTAYMRQFFAATAGANKSANYTIDLVARPFGQVFQIKHKTALEQGGTTNFQHIYVEPVVFTAKTDIELRVTLATNTITAADIGGGFDLVLVDN